MHGRAPIDMYVLYRKHVHDGSYNKLQCYSVLLCTLAPIVVIEVDQSPQCFLFLKDNLNR